MAGRIRIMIDQIVRERSQGNPILEATTRTKLIIKGIQPDAYDLESEDDPVVLEKLRSIGNDLGVSV